MRFVLIPTLVATMTSVACAPALTNATRHEIGAGVGFVAGDDKSDNDTVPMLDDAFAWNADYAGQVCDKCESFRLFVDIPIVVNPDQPVRSPRIVVPDARRELFVVPNARFAVPWGNVAFFAGFGGGVGHFAESSRLTTGGENAVVRSETRAIIGFHGGLEAQLSPRLAIRFGTWALGPRPTLSFPARDTHCTRDCGDTVILVMASGVLRF